MKGLFFVLLIVSNTAFSQQRVKDSTEVANTFNTILKECKNVNFADPDIAKYGTFYKVAPYIIYQGKDEKRKWKDYCNYSVEEEKNGVDEICFRINRTINKADSYKIVQYKTEKESEGLWHILHVSLLLNGKQKQMSFAFLKPGKKFALGDID